MVRLYVMVKLILMFVSVHLFCSNFISPCLFRIAEILKHTLLPYTTKMMQIYLECCHVAYVKFLCRQDFI